MSGAVVLYTTWPDAGTAGAAAREAVEQGLAACANVLPVHQAVYRWEGRLETAEEVAVLFKCGEAAAAPLRDWIAARHPYDLPAILALAAGPASSPAYVAWLNGAPETPQCRGAWASHAPQPS